MIIAQHVPIREVGGVLLECSVTRVRVMPPWYMQHEEVDPCSSNNENGFPSGVTGEHRNDAGKISVAPLQ